MKVTLPMLNKFLDQIAYLLETSDRNTAYRFIVALEKGCDELASQVKARMVIAEDIILAGDNELKEVLKTIPDNCIITFYTCRGIDEHVKEKIMRNVSKELIQKIKIVEKVWQLHVTENDKIFHEADIKIVRAIKPIILSSSSGAYHREKLELEAGKE